ncbi:MAG: LPXTG cell wall anchor domain-containing protein [Clostridiaceae bacterium]|nr:LPXTG cell wall anchor domain-containing protein [Clostridiaceae bacterium]
MRFKRTVFLLMTIMMLFALLSLPVTATIDTDTFMYYLKLDYNAEGGSVCLNGFYFAPGTYNFYSGAIINITITPADGYVIKSITSEKRYPVYVTDIITDFVPTQSYCMSKMMYCNRVITVEFAKICTATALASPSEGGTATVNGETSITASAGTEVVFQAEPNSDDGWYFAGWYTPMPVLEAYSIASSDEDDGLVLVSMDNPYSFVINEDALLVAVFKQRIYNVGIEIIGEGTVTGAGEYSHGEYLNLTATPASGWRFENWYYQDEAFNPVEYRVTTDMAITAKFVEDQKTDTQPRARPVDNEETRYSLNISVEGPGSVSPGPGTHFYYKDMTVVLVPTPEPGAIFLGWFGEDGSDIVDNTVLMNKNKTIIARFETREEVQLLAEPEQEPVPEEYAITIPDDDIPISSPVLPRTGGIPLEFLITSGGLMIAGGIAVGKKKNRR